MASERQSTVIVGASLAGLRTAIALRRNGYEGRIRLFGDEPHWPPFDRPPLSKQVLVGSIDAERARLRVPDDLGLEVVSGVRAIGVDLEQRSIALEGGEEVPFDRLVIATGAQPRIPAAWTGPTVHVLRTIDDSLRLRAALSDRRKVAVVGAGFIGSEVASSCRHLGHDVDLVDISPHPLVPLGPEVGARVAAWHHDAGVRLRLGRAVTELRADARGAHLSFDDGQACDYDLVVVGIGVRPTTDWIEGSGLEIDDGVVCDASCLALGGGGIVGAVGDVARWQHPRFGSVRVEHWTNAGEQAAHVAKALLGSPAPFAPLPYFWSDQHGHKLQFVGLAGPDMEVDFLSAEGPGFVVVYRRDATVMGALCVDAPKALPTWSAAVEQGTIPSGVR